MWTGIYLKGKTLSGWHMINREESLDYWVAGESHIQNGWQDRINPELRGKVWHAATYDVSDDEVEYVKTSCWIAFE